MQVDVRDMGSIPGLEMLPGGGHSSPLQYSCLENPKDRGAWEAPVCEVAQCLTRLKRLSTHVWPLLCWDMFPLYPCCCEFLQWMNVEFYQMLLLHLLRWSHGFCLLFSWCAVSLWSMCVNGITIVTLEWIKLDHGAWSFLCVVRFCLLIFSWGFLHLYSSELLACNFLFW